MKTPRTHSPRACYVTTAIPYVNARPHLGHALEIVIADAFARHRRALGDDVRFFTGTDENSLKNVQAAEREGIATEVLVERHAAHFRELGHAVDASFDDFFRTSTDRRHFEGVKKLWEACVARGDVYKRAYRGLYCTGCEQFYAAEELDGGSCPEHGAVEHVEEDNYFFRLSRYEEALLSRIESGELDIAPAHRRNEAVTFIRRGLVDFSISRSRARAHGWGIPVPGDPEQVIFVWFDALGSYINALGYADDGPLYQKYWVGGAEQVHVIGKGITRFHAIYWPAILLAAGVPLPRKIFVHGYITVEGKKIGKSLGNAVDPLPLVARYGADAVRYYLLRHIRPVEDGDFSLERFVRAHDTELADQLGNLVHRVSAMLHRYVDGAVPAPDGADPVDEALIASAAEAKGRIDRAMEDFAADDALRALFRFIEAANGYVADVAPWKLARLGSEAEPRLRTALFHLVEALRFIARELTPFLPATAAAVANAIGLEFGQIATAGEWGACPVGTRVPPGRILFPKLELDHTPS